MKVIVDPQAPKPTQAPLNFGYAMDNPEYPFKNTKGVPVEEGEYTVFHFFIIHFSFQNNLRLVYLLSCGCV
jgi:hypothetical protein